MASRNQHLKTKDTNLLKGLLTPEIKRKGSSRKENRRKSSLTDNNNKIKKDDENLADKSLEETKRPISRDERAQIKFAHPVYNKAASLFESLKDSEENKGRKQNIEFDSEFERRRAYSLSFAAKRCKYLF